MTAFETRLVHPSGIPGEPSHATSTPLYQTATFHQDDAGAARWDYSRSGNPTRDVLERQLTDLDGAHHAFAYASGIAAVNAVLRLLAPGDEIVCGDDLYGGTLRLLDDHARHLGVRVIQVDTSDPSAVERAVSDVTALILVETPSNPRLRTADIPALARIARRHGARLAVDNSMLSPYLQRPLDLGADIAIQSATKLLGGHGDLTAGVVATNDAALAERLAFLRNAEGTALAPFESWLLIRGLETLAVRLERQLDNVARLLPWLRGHPAIRRVHYPGSPDLAPRSGVVISVETGSVPISRRLVAATRLFRTTVSFGCVTSSISLPCTMSHASVPEARRAQSGLAEDLVRISVGIEAADDLVADLERALGEEKGKGEPRGPVIRSESVSAPGLLGSP